MERLNRGTRHRIGALAPGASGRGEAAAAPPAGSLLLYTDVLVETPTRNFDDGNGLPTSVLRRIDDTQTPQQVCDTLVDVMIGADPEDDVAVLAVRVDRS